MSFERKRSQLGDRPKHIELEGRQFEFVTGQRGDASAVYKADDAFIRIGSATKILPDLALHKKMEEFGFPVAKLIAEGEQNGQAYFVEASLGEKHFGKLFAEGIEERGTIPAPLFEEFISVSEKLAEAQLRTAVSSGSFETFAHGVHVDTMCEELPEKADLIQARFEEARERMQAVPFVITHGDYNPNNLYPAGLIDLEDSFYGPYGYDLVSAVCHIDSFPDSHEYEYFAKYRFTDEQKTEYFARMDAHSVRAGLPPLTKFKDDFEFCRALWLAARMQETPKMQQFRYDFLTERFLS